MTDKAELFLYREGETLKMGKSTIIPVDQAKALINGEAVIVGKVELRSIKTDIEYVFYDRPSRFNKGEASTIKGALKDLKAMIK